MESGIKSGSAMPVCLVLRGLTGKGLYRRGNGGFWEKKSASGLVVQDKVTCSGKLRGAGVFVVAACDAIAAHAGAVSAGAAAVMRARALFHLALDAVLLQPQ